MSSPLNRYLLNTFFNTSQINTKYYDYNFFFKETIFLWAYLTITSALGINGLLNSICIQRQSFAGFGSLMGFFDNKKKM